MIVFGFWNSLAFGTLRFIDGPIIDLLYGKTYVAPGEP
jgi:hypothetical protein